MAADILLYDTTHVPVGDDQNNTRLCRDIAQKFNNDFKVEDFLNFEPLIQKEFSKLGLKDGLKK